MDSGPAGSEGHSTLSFFSCVEPEAKVSVGNRGPTVSYVSVYVLDVSVSCGCCNKAPQN